MFYGGSKGGAKSIEHLYDKILCSTERCLKCLKRDEECTFHCKVCYNEKTVCHPCKALGYTDWHPLLRACETCLRNEYVCTRLLPLVWTSDCDPKQKSFMNTMLSDKEKYPYHVPIPDCPHNIKSVRSAEFWYWIDMEGYLVNIRLLLVSRRENEDIKKCLSLKALRNKDRMDVETAVEIHREKVQNAIPDIRISTTLVPELEFKHWKKNGANLLKCPCGIAFSGKYSKLFVTDRLLHAVYMVDMHCPSNVTLVTGGVGQGYVNGIGRKSKFNSPSGIAAHGDQLYICDQGNGRIRVVNVASLFCHAS